MLSVRWSTSTLNYSNLVQPLKKFKPKSTKSDLSPFVHTFRPLPHTKARKPPSESTLSQTPRGSTFAPPPESRRPRPPPKRRMAGNTTSDEYSGSSAVMVVDKTGGFAVKMEKLSRSQEDVKPKFENRSRATLGMVVDDDVFAAGTGSDMTSKQNPFGTSTTRTPEVKDEMMRRVWAGAAKNNGGTTGSSPLTTAPPSERGSSSKPSNRATFPRQPSHRNFLNKTPTTSSSSLTPPPSSSQLPHIKSENITPTKRKLSPSISAPHSRSPTPTPMSTPRVKRKCLASSASLTPTKAVEEGLTLSQVTSGLSSAPPSPSPLFKAEPTCSGGSTTGRRAMEIDEMLEKEGAVIARAGLGREISRWRDEQDEEIVERENENYAQSGLTRSNSEIVPSSDPAEQMRPLYRGGKMEAATTSPAGVGSTEITMGNEMEEATENEVDMFGFDDFDWDEPDEQEKETGLDSMKVDGQDEKPIEADCDDGAVGGSANPLTPENSSAQDSHTTTPTIPDQDKQSTVVPSSPRSTAHQDLIDKKTNSALDQIRARANEHAKEKEAERQAARALLLQEESSESEEEEEIVTLALDKLPAMQRVLRSATIESRVSEDVKPIMPIARKKEALPEELLKLRAEYMKRGKFGKTPGAYLLAEEKEDESNDAETRSVYAYSSSEDEGESSDDDDENEAEQEKVHQLKPASLASRWLGVTESLHDIPCEVSSTISG